MATIKPKRSIQHDLQLLIFYAIITVVLVSVAIIINVTIFSLVYIGVNKWYVAIGALILVDLMILRMIKRK